MRKYYVGWKHGKQEKIFEEFIHFANVRIYQEIHENSNKWIKKYQKAQKAYRSF